MDTSSLIELSNLEVFYSSRQILHGLTVNMPMGSIGLLGPNGAGKSTLIKTLMGFIQPQIGTARVFGYDCKSRGSAIRQQIGYMPEEDTYIPGMTAVQFVSYCGMLCG